MSNKKYQLKVCKLARKHHASNCRSFAHVFHHRNTICVAPTFAELPIVFRAGILLHELGHLTYDPKEQHSEEDADQMGYVLSGVPVFRRNYRGAKNLEVIRPRDLPKAVKFIKGSIE